MTEVVLHHYAGSPFAEKVRAILGFKQLTWRSVDIPIAMPKPDLVALTGGYRKTPVMQIGCDVYCDTLTIARALDRSFPERPVFAPTRRTEVVAAGRWLDHQHFFAVIAQLFDPAVVGATLSSFGDGPAAAAAFAKDRAAMMQGATVVRPPVDQARVIFANIASDLEARLAAGATFAGGTQPDWLDFCLYHPFWMLSNYPAVAERLAPYVGVSAWLQRMKELGHGTPEPFSAADALELARSSKPLPQSTGAVELPDGIAIGDRVAVGAADYALETSVGTLVSCELDEVAILRSDARAGEVVVHFPRIGYRVSREAAES